MNKFIKQFLIKLKLINIKKIFLLVLIFSFSIIILAFIKLVKANINQFNFKNKLILINEKVYYFKSDKTDLNLSYKVIDNFLDLINYDEDNFLFLNYNDNKFNLYLFSTKLISWWNYFKGFDIKKIYSIQQKDLVEYIGSFSKGNINFLFFDKFIFVFEIDQDFNIKKIFKIYLNDISKDIFNKNSLSSILYSYEDKILVKADNDYFIFEVNLYNNKINLKLLKKISLKDKENIFIINQLFVDKNNLVFYSFFEKYGNEFYYIIQDIYDNCYYKTNAVNSYESNYIILDKIGKLLFIQNNNSISIIYNNNDFISISNSGYYVHAIKFKNDLIILSLNNSGLSFYKLNQFNKKVEPLFSIKDVVYAFKNKNYIYFIKKEEDSYYYVFAINVNDLIKDNQDFNLKENFIRNSYMELNFIPERFFIFN
ncbi:MAG: hypothetical protein ACP5O4_00975 [bacterium]|jgi:hypothetical protein